MEYDITEAEGEEQEFLWLCTKDLNTTKHIFGSIRELTLDDARDKRLRYWLLIALVVTYMRPFSGNRGKVKRTHSLKKEDVVPSAIQPLHDRLASYRHEQFAHTDITFFNPGIANVGTVENPRWSAVFKNPNFEFLDKNLQGIGDLIVAVDQRVNAMLNEKLAYRLSRVVRPPTITPPPS